jgi:hypothetical protein
MSSFIICMLYKMFMNSVDLSSCSDTNSCSLAKKSPSVRGTQKFVTLYAGASHYTLSLAR